MTVFFDARFDGDPLMQQNRALYDAAKKVVEGTSRIRTRRPRRSRPGSASRRSAGSSTTSSRRCPRANQPALVQFVTQTKRGYCQHFAGAMALMLRYLGIPARVAAGFTSGSYDADSHEWTVTDHEAHDWVEVYFPGWGWIPFDPTPGRGTLDARYSSTSPEFNGAEFIDSTSRTAGRGGAPQSSALIAVRRRRPGQESSGIGNSRGGGVVVNTVRDKGPSIVVLAFLVLAAAALVVIGLKTVRRTLRFTGRDPRELAGACRRDLMAYLADQGMEVPPSATLGELGELVERYFAVDAGPVRARGDDCALRAARPGPRRARSRPARAPAGPERHPQPHQHDEPRPRRAQPPLAGRLSSPLHAVVMAAGEGRRLRPLTERWPKPILPIDGKPVIATLLRELAGAGIGAATVVTGHLAEQVEELVGDGSAFGDLRGLRAPAGAARLGRRRPARARGRSVRAAPRGRRRHGVPARRCRPRVRGVAGLGGAGRPGRPPRRRRGEDARAGRGSGVSSRSAASAAS